MPWSKRISNESVVCLNCGRGISLKPLESCKESKHFTYFEKKKKRNNEYRREKRKINPYFANYTLEEKKNYEKRKYKEKRNDLIFRLGGKCAQCGGQDIRCLEIDHKNGGGGKERKLYGWKYFRYLYKLSEIELKEKYQVLCANCHAIKTYSST